MHSMAMSGYKKAVEESISRVAIMVHERTDYPGNDYDHILGLSFDECVTRCDEAYQCRAFTYVARRQECWLKSAASHPVPIG